jgi:serine protease Do
MTIQSLEAGSSADIGIMRDGKRLSVTAVIAKLNEGDAAESEKQPGGKATPQLALLNGVGLEELNDDYRGQLQLPGDLEGIIVTEIDENSPAGDAGLAQGDVIVQVNLKTVASMADFNALIKNFRGNKLMLTVFRRGAFINIVLKE